MDDLNNLYDLSFDHNSNDEEMPLRFNSGFRFKELHFHRSTEPNASLNGNGTISLETIHFSLIFAIHKAIHFLPFSFHLVLYPSL